MPREEPVAVPAADDLLEQTVMQIVVPNLQMTIQSDLLDEPPE
jgi:hypothetical protein